MTAPTTIIARPIARHAAPLVLEFPFPAWATRPEEAGPAEGEASGPEDPFAGLTEDDAT